MLKQVALVGTILTGFSCNSADSPSLPVEPGADVIPEDPVVPVDPNQIREVEFGMTERPLNPTCVAAERPQVNTRFELHDEFGGLSFSRPLLALQSPSEQTRWYIVEQAGRVRWFDAALPSPAKNTFLDIRSTVLAHDDNFPGYKNELGLLGMAFDPNFENNGFVYLSYTVSMGGAGVQRMEAQAKL